MTDPNLDLHTSLASVADMATAMASIVGRHGRAVLDDRQRLIGLLRDKAPTQARGIRILINALDENVPLTFTSVNSPPSADDRTRAANRIVENTGIQPELAQWVVDVWADALASPALMQVVQVANPQLTETKPDAASTASAKEPAPPMPSSDDLVWGGTDLVAADAVKPAPDYLPAPSYQPAPSAAATPSVAPSPPTANKTFFGQWKLSHVVIGALCLAALGYLSDYLATPKSPSQPTPAPAPVTARPKVEPAPQPKEPELTLLSTDSDATKWPLFEAGAPVKDVPRSFRFQFNFKHRNGHIYTYRPTVAFPDNARQGKGVIVAVDQAENTQAMLSETAITAVSRDLVSGTKIYSVSFMTTSWVKNPLAVPSICLSFTSGSQASKFEPDKAFFCATELKNNTCGVSFGCGRLK